MARRRKASAKKDTEKVVKAEEPKDTKKVVDMDKKLAEVKPASGLTPFQIYMREQISGAGKAK